jgi:hypothetical protein
VVQVNEIQHVAVHDIYLYSSVTPVIMGHCSSCSNILSSSVYIDSLWTGAAEVDDTT